MSNYYYCEKCEKAVDVKTIVLSYRNCIPTSVDTVCKECGNEVKVVSE
jgi:hypothetical protein